MCRCSLSTDLSQSDFVVPNGRADSQIFTTSGGYLFFSLTYRQLENCLRQRTAILFVSIPNPGRVVGPGFREITCLRVNVRPVELLPQHRVDIFSFLQLLPLTLAPVFSLGFF